MTTSTPLWLTIISVLLPIIISAGGLYWISKRAPVEIEHEHATTEQIKTEVAAKWQEMLASETEARKEVLNRLGIAENTISETQKDVSSLKAENAKLRREIARLKEENANLRTWAERLVAQLEAHDIIPEPFEVKEEQQE